MPDVTNLHVAQSPELTALFLFNLCQEIDLDEFYAIISHLERCHSLPVPPAAFVPSRLGAASRRN